MSPGPPISFVLIKKLLFSCVNNVGISVKPLLRLGHLVIFSAIKTQKISTDWKCRLPLEKQFNIKLLSKKTGRKTFSSFRKSCLKNLLGLYITFPYIYMFTWLGFKFLYYLFYETREKLIQFIIYQVSHLRRWDMRKLVSNFCLDGGGIMTVSRFLTK